MSFAPPSGVAFHTAEEISVSDLAAVLARVVLFLQRLQAAPQRLCLYHDWWQHDGLHFKEREITFHDLFAMVETPRALFGIAPDDHEVFIGVSPEDGCWYLRFRAEWDADERYVVGRWAVIVPREIAASFRLEVAIESKQVLVEESSERYYESVRV